MYQKSWWNLPRARTQIISLFGALSSTRGEAIDSANLVWCWLIWSYCCQQKQQHQQQQLPKQQQQQQLPKQQTCHHWPDNNRNWSSSWWDSTVLGDNDKVGGASVHEPEVAGDYIFNFWYITSDVFHKPKVAEDFYFCNKGTYFHNERNFAIWKDISPDDNVPLCCYSEHPEIR